MDAVGLDIPHVASEAAGRLGFPPLEPACSLYEALLEVSGVRRPEVREHQQCGWLPAELEPWARAVIDVRGALPQEALDREALRRVLR